MYSCKTDTTTVGRAGI